MGLFQGISYNLKGLKLGLKTPRLLMLGFIRFAVVIVLTIISASLLLVYREEIMALIWTQPESRWILWLWQALAWMLSLFLVAFSSVFSYLASQIFFCVFIMDSMSKITERIMTNELKQSDHQPMFIQFVFLIKQEIPRAVIPLLLSVGLMMLGWLTPLGPVTAIISSAIAAVFLAWDNTDLIPARRLESFKDRFGFLLKNFWFHLGFGLWFLVPVLNILFLSFAPVGATLYYIDRTTQPGTNPIKKLNPGGLLD